MATLTNEISQDFGSDEKIKVNLTVAPGGTAIQFGAMVIYSAWSNLLRFPDSLSISTVEFQIRIFVPETHNAG